MMKGIIVVDKKKTCLDCRFCREIQEGIEACCELTIDEKDDELFKMIDTDYCQDVPEWCPILPIPEKREELKTPYSMADFQRKGVSIGWNDCIDEIMRLQNTSTK